MKIPSSRNYTIKGGDGAFVNRQKALFDQLFEAEKNHRKDQPSANPEDSDETLKFSDPVPLKRRHRHETRPFRGKESIFKRPELPSPFSDRGIPDYRRNPHKWVKYTLDDVLNADMSDKSNTAAALSFLQELKARKFSIDVDETNKNITTSSSSVVTFKKPISKTKNFQSPVIVANDDRPAFRGSKIILPEYVVGQMPVNRVKREKKDVVKIDQSKQLKLDHLVFTADDDDDN